MLEYLRESFQSHEEWKMVVDLSMIQGDVIFVIDGAETKCTLEKVVGGGIR